MEEQKKERLRSVKAAFLPICAQYQSRYGARFISVDNEARIETVKNWIERLVEIGLSGPDVVEINTKLLAGGGYKNFPPRVEDFQRIWAEAQFAKGVAGTNKEELLESFLATDEVFFQRYGSLWRPADFGNRDRFISDWMTEIELLNLTDEEVLKLPGQSIKMPEYDRFPPKLGEIVVVAATMRGLDGPDIAFRKACLGGSSAGHIALREAKKAVGAYRLRSGLDRGIRSDFANQYKKALRDFFSGDLVDIDEDNQEELSSPPAKKENMSRVFGDILSELKK